MVTAFFAREAVEPAVLARYFALECSLCCDTDALPAYLEGSTEDNARLYERLGFERREKVEALAGVWLRPKLREPR